MVCRFFQCGNLVINNQKKYALEINGLPIIGLNIITIKHMLFCRRDIKRFVWQYEISDLRVSYELI